MSLNDVQLLLADVAIVIILARLLGAAARRIQCLFHRVSRDFTRSVAHLQNFSYMKNILD